MKKYPEHKSVVYSGTSPLSETDKIKDRTHETLLSLTSLLDIMKSRCMYLQNTINSYDSFSNSFDVLEETMELKRWAEENIFLVGFSYEKSKK